MSLRAALAARVPPGSAIEAIGGGDLSEVLLVTTPAGDRLVAKSGPAVEVEAAMLRAIAGVAPAPTVVSAADGVLLMRHVANDGAFTPQAWASLGEGVRRLHASVGERYGWPEDYAFGAVPLHNGWSEDWPRFWGEQRLIATAEGLDPSWRGRIERAARRLSDLLPARPPASLLHGDLWSGNVLVHRGALAALIDPACYHGHAEVDLAMLSLFGAPPAAFWSAYGPLEPGWEERRHAYQLFPALVHLRLFGGGYAGLVDRLLGSLGA